MKTETEKLAENQSEDKPEPKADDKVETSPKEDT